MANRLILELGVNSVSIPLNLTIAQIRAAIKRYAVQSGIAIEGRTDAEIAEDVLRSLKKVITDKSIDRQRYELLEAQRSAIDATLNADNDL